MEMDTRTMSGSRGVDYVSGLLMSTRNRMTPGTWWVAYPLAQCPCLWQRAVPGLPQALCARRGRLEFRPQCHGDEQGHGVSSRGFDAEPDIKVEALIMSEWILVMLAEIKPELGLGERPPTLGAALQGSCVYRAGCFFSGGLLRQANARRASQRREKMLLFSLLRPASKCIVKFVQRYGVEVHTQWAAHGYAPPFSCKPLEMVATGWWWTWSTVPKRLKFYRIFS
ncbi:hypothetical protein SELMODRAFT_441098 [Selaginella moellendorffii]|uniref:Uncharacterized protein n=1 Tax=Selaginella moellendorffii TaxID=88036 RepID=D8RGF9_SELML|nr:hypothetical protein SELMODRAFT_441098 [Selaginella moellendorffii]